MRLVGDPLLRRFTGLARVPTGRTVGNWLRRFTQETLRPLVRLNQDLDERRNCADTDLPPGALVIRFRRWLDPAAVLRVLG